MQEMGSGPGRGWCRVTLMQQGQQQSFVPFSNWSMPHGGNRGAWLGAGEPYRNLLVRMGLVGLMLGSSNLSHFLFSWVGTRQGLHWGPETAKLCLCRMHLLMSAQLIPRPLKNPVRINFHHLSSAQPGLLPVK